MAALSAPQPPPPYSVKEVAELLGLSEDHVADNYAAFQGLKAGRRILIPRHAVDPLVYGPEGEKAPVERVLAHLPALTDDERRRVAVAALTQGAS